MYSLQYLAYSGLLFHSTETNLVQTYFMQHVRTQARTHACTHSSVLAAPAQGQNGSLRGNAYYCCRPNSPPHETSKAKRSLYTTIRLVANTQASRATIAPCTRAARAGPDILGTYGFCCCCCGLPAPCCKLHTYHFSYVKK